MCTLFTCQWIIMWFVNTLGVFLHKNRTLKIPTINLEIHSGWKHNGCVWLPNTQQKHFFYCSCLGNTHQKCVYDIHLSNQNIFLLCEKCNLNKQWNPILLSKYTQWNTFPLLIEFAPFLTQLLKGNAFLSGYFLEITNKPWDGKSKKWWE